MGKRSLWAIPFLILLAAFFLSGCGNQIAFTKIEPPPPEPPSVTEIFGTIKPALIVRNTGCVTCHSQVRGDFITDLGKGDSFFLGADSPTNHPNQTGYSPLRSQRFVWHQGGWRSTAFFGDIYLPEATIEDQQLLTAFTSVPGQNIPSGGLKVVDFAKGQYIHPDDTTNTPSKLVAKTSSPNPGVGGLRGDFQTRQFMRIAAPTEARIRSLAGLKGTVTLEARGDSRIIRGPRATLSGLRIVTGVQNRTYVAHDESVTCYGDNIIDGVLFLKNLRVQTDGKGCRLYVSGSVFIQGTIEYVGGDSGGKNLQISSARAIVFGMRSMRTRFAPDASPATLTGLRGHLTDAMEQTFNDRVISDRDRLIGLTDDAGPIRVIKDTATQEVLAYEETFDLHTWKPAPGHTSYPDPATCSETGPCTVTWANDFQRKTVNYDHLILNAPVIHGRYFGRIRGALIAEKVLMAVSKLQFEADSTLSTAPFLPLIGREAFDISPE